MNKKMLVIINPCAGRTKSQSGTFDIVDVLSTLDYDFNIKTTTKRGDATEYAKKYGAEYDVILCCGGDGTLNETINGVMQLPEKKPIGYIPTGSTNDLANTIGIPADIRSAVQLIVTDQKNTYDIGCFNDRFFSYIAAFGIGTDFSYSTPQKMKNIFGHTAYMIDSFMLHLPRTLKGVKPHHMRIEYDGGVIEDDFFFGSVSNSTAVGGIFKFRKEFVKLNDGKFELFLVRNVSSVPHAAQLLMKARNQDYECDEFVLIHTNKLKIHTDEATPWTLDGEFGGAPNDIDVSVKYHGIEIFSPQNEMFVY